MSLWNTPPTTSDENSKAAAASMIMRAGTIRRMVAKKIAETGPVAAWELEQMLNMSGNTIRPRIWELYHRHVIYRAEEKGVTPSGRACWKYMVDPYWESTLEDDE